MRQDVNCGARLPVRQSSAGPGITGPGGYLFLLPVRLGRATAGRWLVGGRALLAAQHPDQAAAQLPAALAAFADYAAVPGADVIRAGADLAGLAAQLAAAGLLSEAAQVREAAAAITPG